MKLEKLQPKTITDDTATHELIYIGKRAYIVSGDVYYATKQVVTTNKNGTDTFNFTWDDQKPLSLENINK